MALAIKIEGLSKVYQLGEIGTGTLAWDLERWLARLRKKEDRFTKIDENDVTQGNSKAIWSLKDISFDIREGDAVGIIGRNGAGKSTLLKILSRVTSPSSGRMRVKGRIASLLEVGTGFHPELTGRENIFLNGAILGMRKIETAKKFNEIVDFSGVERHIDTPVKRYSSGMYVRLAFAVAAHLESEILIVDEVLAVGDGEFQKKCLNKMKEVSKTEGRTVLFVSHTMSAIKQLCSRSILLSQGKVELEGATIDVINHYISYNPLATFNKVIIPRQIDKEFCFTSISIVDENDKDVSQVEYSSDFFIRSTFIVAEEVNNVEISLCFKNSSGVNVFFTSLSDAAGGRMADIKMGSYSTLTKIRRNFLMPDTYTLEVYAHQRNSRNLDSHLNVIKFIIVETDSYMAPYGKAGNDFTCVLDVCNWNLSNVSTKIIEHEYPK